jgi:predicted nucleic acid-binding protein
LILVDTSVWVDHLRRGDAQLIALLESAQVATHPFVIGEIACGSLANRQTVLALLQDLPMATVADSDEVLTYIERHRLYGKGIGYVDVHLLAAVALTEDASLWTRDRRLHAAAASLRCAYLEPGSH